MITKDSFSILISKYSLVYKIAIALFVALLIFGIIGYAILTPTLSTFVKELKMLNLDDTIKEYLLSIFKGVADNDLPSDEVTNPQNPGMTQEYQNLVQGMRDALAIFKQNLGAIWGGIVAIIILIILFAIFYYICLYTVTDIMNAFMSSDSEYGFTSNLVANLSRSIRFALAYVGLSLVILAFIFALSLGLGFLFSAWNNLIGIIISYFTLLVLLSVKRALFAGWMPAYVVSDMTLKESLVANFKIAQKYFKDSLGMYLMLYLFALILAAVVGVLTLGIGFMIVVSMCTVFAQAFDLVNYYHYSGKKYYKDVQHVVDPTKKYKDAVLDNPLDNSL